MSIKNIAEVLDTHLRTFVGLPGLQTMNTLYVPKHSERYVRATLLPNPKVQLSIGINGRDEIKGIYQIDIFEPLNSGALGVLELADDISEHFPRGLSFALGSGVLHINRASVTAGTRYDKNYMVSVLVEFSTVL